MFDLPPDLKPTDPQFMQVLNDRLRRISSSSSSSSTSSAATSTGSSQLILSVPGTLAIASDLAPKVSIPERRQVAEVVAYLKNAPAGAACKVKVVVDGATTLCTLEIAAGAVSATVTSPGAIAANVPVRIDVTSVGTSFPGSHLTVLIRFA